MTENNYNFKTFFDNNAFFQLAISKERSFGKKLQATINYNLNIEGYDKNQILFNLIGYRIETKNGDSYSEIVEKIISKTIDLTCVEI